MDLGIIFDMDNTLLQSRINFKQMRKALIRFLADHQLGQETDFEQDLTPAQVLERGKRLVEQKGEEAWLVDQMYQIVTQYEAEGMRHVQLEDGVAEGLDQLRRDGLLLTVVTNNAYEAAITALDQNQILSYFDLVVGREQMEALKPSPSGLVVVKEAFPRISEWVMLGDSWIDGKAAQLAGIPFVAYKGSRSAMEERGITPSAFVDQFQRFVDWVASWKESVRYYD